MSKGKSRVILALISLVALIFGVFLLMKQSDIRVGFGTKDEKELDIGNYNAKDIGIEGKYAVVAISGEGTFQLVDQDDKEKKI
ncbi:hypothetical protein CEW92_11670 [Bacillaceae bacterium SAS-127]|nr:hypothetical protein CEW92_11670 [Bacillaceae bacterium SAS-127]